MYINDITLENFRSYRAPRTVYQYSKKLNTLIGINGTGKTNLLEAIYFVFSDEYSSLSETEKKRFIYQGPDGKRELTASVTISFHTWDMICNKDEFIKVKRVIGKKIDDYFLTNRRVTKNGLRHFMMYWHIPIYNDSYYIRQGAIERMIHFSEKQRLDYFWDFVNKEFQESLLKDDFDNIVFDGPVSKLGRMGKSRKEMAYIEAAHLHFVIIFKKIVKAFNAIFKTITTYGKAIFILKDKKGKTVKLNLDNSEMIYKVQGIGVRATFVKEKFKEFYEEMSYGEKALINICQVFACQKIRPAPLYLIDDLEQSLSRCRRIEVANYIATRSTITQTFLSSSVMEYLRKSNNIYHIIFCFKQSSIFHVEGDLGSYII